MNQTTAVRTDQHIDLTHQELQGVTISKTLRIRPKGANLATETEKSEASEICYLPTERRRTGSGATENLKE